MTKLDRPRELVATVHGVRHPGDGDSLVSADVFRNKFTKLLATLKAADRQSNQELTHSYFVSRLKVGSAEFGLLERPLPKKIPILESPVAAVFDLVDAVYHSNFEAARRLNGVANRLEELCSGVGEKFEKIELALDDEGPVIPVDTFFKAQVERFLRSDLHRETTPFFAGQSIGSFDGDLKEIDFRGKLWRGILVLSGTNREIVCTFDSSLGDEAVKPFVNTRVWAEGNAIYDGSLALPQRLEVQKLRGIGRTGDPSYWKNTLLETDEPEWGDDIDRLH